MIGIYKIENATNGKIYIGQSTDILRRWRAHRAKYSNSDSVVARAMRKYGIESFSFEVVEECNKDLLNEREIYWIRFFNCHVPNGYNVAIGGQNGASVEKEIQSFEIKELLKDSNLEMKEIANLYGLHFQTISDINNGKLWTEDLDYPIRKRTPYGTSKICPDCGSEKTTTSMFCKKCSEIKRKKKSVDELNSTVTREELKNLIRNCSFLEIGKRFEVSDNAIRKWCIRYNLPFKKTEIKKISNKDWELI